jgi:large subunit ribosomal protein L16
LTGGQIFRLKLLLKRSVKKSDKTRRSVWFHAFPHLPLSRKPVGLRMGKGKGKLHCWFANIRGGTILFEFKNLRPGRSLFFVKQVEHKLGVRVKYISKMTEYFQLPLKHNKSVVFKSFW